jgi:hypothetical protein
VGGGTLRLLSEAALHNLDDACIIATEETPIR